MRFKSQERRHFPCVVEKMSNATLRRLKTGHTGSWWLYRSASAARDPALDVAGEPGRGQTGRPNATSFSLSYHIYLGAGKSWFLVSHHQSPGSSPSGPITRREVKSMTPAISSSDYTHDEVCCIMTTHQRLEPWFSELQNCLRTPASFTWHYDSTKWILNTRYLGPVFMVQSGTDSNSAWRTRLIWYIGQIEFVS